MTSVYAKLGILAALILAAPSAFAGPFMETGRKASPPPAVHSFCQLNPSQCVRQGRNVKVVSLTNEAKGQLESVNSYVNGRYYQITDMAKYGVLDHWSLMEDGSGDCEDFVLLKRKMLIEAGWPSSVLLITVVLDSTTEPHAVLTVRTDVGDYILDNKASAILPWDRAGYSYVMTQSQSNPKIWNLVK